MEKNGIDASLGLSLSLEILKRYQQNGLLHAEISRFPGIRGACQATLHLTNGEVVSVHLQDKQGRNYPLDKETLCRLDREKGPFEWILIPQPVLSEQPQGTEKALSLSPEPQAYSQAYSIECSFVPKIISVLTWDWLSTQTPEQRDALYTVLTTINGVYTVEDIKAIVPFPSDMVDDLLRTLLALKVIAISTE